jgi:hypothetical protein
LPAWAIRVAEKQPAAKRQNTSEAVLAEALGTALIGLKNPSPVGDKKNLNTIRPGGVTNSNI